MAGGTSRNLRLADWLYTFVKQHPEGKTVSQCRDYLVSERQNVGKNRKKKGTYTFSSSQICGVLNSSPLFEELGEIRQTYLTSGGVVKLYGARDITEVVDKIMLTIHSPHTIRKTHPRCIKIELKKRGVEI